MYACSPSGAYGVTCACSPALALVRWALGVKSAMYLLLTVRADPAA